MNSLGEQQQELSVFERAEDVDSSSDADGDEDPLAALMDEYEDSNG